VGRTSSNLDVISSEPTARPEAAGPPLVLTSLRDRYAIEGEIGHGGMGRVFAARDLKLGRQVAIKVLPPGAHGEEELRRFEQEARAAGSLEHPNVLVVHDIGVLQGEPFIVSELLRGATLRERLRRRPMPSAKALDYAFQLAQGLRAAHDKGIVHRDLKPENLFVTHEGRLKILDFGIAKLSASDRPSENSTVEGAILGTVRYMAPEQVRGQRADHRSDIFACGSILYEMLAGRPAFAGGTDLETASGILNDEPPPSPVGPELERILRRCLEKDPADRFQSAADLALALSTLTSADRRPHPRWFLVGAAALAAAALILLPKRGSRSVERNSIAVLPFANLSSDKDNEYFSDGVTEELISALANVEGLHVVSRTSAFALKDGSLDVKAIGHRLDVATVLEGSVRREGNNLRISAQLVDTADGMHLWSRTYERELKNVFSLEDELARSIAQTLRAKLLPASAPLAPQTTSSVEAHDLYLKGRFVWNKRTEAAINQAIEYFQQAIEKDAGYALAYVGLADANSVLVQYSSRAPLEILPRARRAAQKAVEIGETLGEAHAALALTRIQDYDWPAAEAELRRAIGLKPEYASAHHWLALTLLYTGRLEEARAEIERAQQLDPTSLIIGTVACQVLSDSRQYDRAIERCRKTLELDPGFGVGRAELGMAYLEQGKYPEAAAEFEKLDPSWRLGERGYAYAKSGRTADARRVLVEMEARSKHEWITPVGRALIHIALGQKDAAFTLLNEACQQRDWKLAEVKVSAMYDSLRSDPRYTAVVKCVHLD